jgi:hypothetical protein
MKNKFATKGKQHAPQAALHIAKVTCVDGHISFSGEGSVSFRRPQTTPVLRSESRCALATGVEVMSTSVYTGPKLFNFISKHFLQICL